MSSAAQAAGGQHVVSIPKEYADPSAATKGPSGKQGDPWRKTTKTVQMLGLAVVACLLLSAVILIPLAWTQTGAFKPEQPSQKEIASLFDRWNNALQTGDPEKVAALYAPNAVLLLTVSNVPSNTHELRVDYFKSFLKLKPFGTIDQRFITINCRTCAIDSGLYTFKISRDGQPETVKARYTFEYKKMDGKWMIVNHHSSALPEREMPTEEFVKSLFDIWNQAIQTQDPKKVVALYDEKAVLLPTVSNPVRTNKTAIEDYFVSFLKNKPVATMVEQHVMIPSPILAMNSGVYRFSLTKNGTQEQVVARYTFVYKKVGENWLIEEHHSSAMPEGGPLPAKAEIAGLFDTWNKALASKDPKKVADLYEEDAVLLPTLSNNIRTNRSERIDYFENFLKKEPQGKILESHIIMLSDKLAMHEGIYEFTFGADGSKAKARFSYVYTKKSGKWLIQEHHSSVMPEQALPTKAEIAGLFNSWNAALATLSPEKVADMYADDAILLPTLSNNVRTTRAERIDYFTTFLKKKPQGKIEESHIVLLSPTSAMHNGIYEFTFGADGSKAKARFSYVYTKKSRKWLIQEHHSSKMPEP